MSSFVEHQPNSRRSTLSVMHSRFYARLLAPNNNKDGRPREIGASFGSGNERSVECRRDEGALARVSSRPSDRLGAARPEGRAPPSQTSDVRSPARPGSHQTVGFGLTHPVPERPAEEADALMAEINPMFW